MATTTTTTNAQEAQSVTLKQCDSLQAKFNYWNSTSSPQPSEVKVIFEGQHPKETSVLCTVTDIRQHEPSSFNLSNRAFQILHHKSSLLPPQSQSIPDFHDKSLMTSIYWPELVSLVKSQLGVRTAVAINTTVRDILKIEDDNFRTGNPRANPKQSFHPFHVVHGDYTPGGARSHMRAMLPSFFEDNDCIENTTGEERRDFFKLRDAIIDAENQGMKDEGVQDQWQWSGKNYKGPRWAILSVWRPLETVHRDPLAVMDPTSLFNGKKQPYAAFDRPYNNRPGFIKEYTSSNLMPIAPENGEEHKWYYLSEQKPEEVYALKLFDSEAHKEGSQVAECLPHSAFALPNQDDQPLRRSVEVRMMVIW